MGILRLLKVYRGAAADTAPGAAAASRRAADHRRGDRSMAGGWLAFRSAPLPSVGVAVIGMSAGAALGGGAVLLRCGAAVDWASVRERLLAVAAPAFALVVVLVLLYRVYVGAEGLRGYTAWGNYRTLPWAAVGSARPVHLLGLRYLRVVSIEGDLPVWVPLFLADMPGFRAAVREFAGPNHVLSTALAGDSVERPRRQPVCP